MFFVDYNIIHMLVFDNYVQYVRKDTSLEDLDAALDSFRDGDNVERIIKENRDYQVLNSLCYFSAIRPSLLIKRSVPFLYFPQILARYSSSRKKQRLLRELRNHYTKSTSFLNDNAVLDYTDSLNEIIADMLKNNEFGHLVKLFENYDLTYSSIKEHLECFSQRHTQSKGIGSASAKSKTSFKKFYDLNTNATKSKVVKSGKKDTKASVSVISSNNEEELSDMDTGDAEEVMNEIYDI